MLYEKFCPHTELEPFVECYFIWDSAGVNVHNLMVESPPNGFPSMVFNLGAPYFIQNKKYDRLEVPESFIAGQSIYSYKLFLEGVIDIAGIVFKPAGIASLLGIDFYAFTEERMDLKKLIGEDQVNSIRQNLINSPDSKKKASRLEDFIFKQFQRRKPEPDFIDKAANKIVEKNGMLNVNDLMENIFMSRRNFERKFFKKVGLSPKYYARIRRMGYLMNSIAGKKEVDWMRILHECEYFDQSHFIKDFLEFTGRTPRHYLAENRELANFVEKPQLQPL